jgi:hypothetical protein
MFTSSAIILTVNFQSHQTSSLTHAVLSPAHLQQGFCIQKTYCASERLLLLTMHHLKGLLKFTVCCGGTVTELKKMA